MQKTRLTNKEKIAIYVTLKIANFIIDAIIAGVLAAPIAYIIYQYIFIG